MIDNLNSHFIVCGLGRVGRSASKELRKANVPILILDRNGERVERAVQAGRPAAVTRVSEAESERKLRRAGADVVFAIYTISGQRLSQSLLKPHVRTQLRSDLGIIVLAIHRSSGEMVSIEPAKEEIGAGDNLIVMGAPQQLRRLEELMEEKSA